MWCVSDGGAAEVTVKILVDSECGCGGGPVGRKLLGFRP